MKRAVFNKRQKKYIYGFGVGVIILLFFGGIYHLTGVNVLSGFKERKVESDISKNDWALYNYGQSINGNKGVEGVDINIISAWDITKGEKGIIVAVVDSGVDSSSSKLKDCMLINSADPIDGKDNDQNGFNDDYYGWDFYNNDNSIYDDYLYDYHGTYICTTISKVAPDVKILPVKFLKSTSGSTEDAILAIKYAIDRGAKIINCSWNFQNDSNELYNLIKNNPDIVFVCAAGNMNVNLDEEKLYPCSFDLENMISVMSIDNSGEPYVASGYGRVVDVAAPGVDVEVSLPENDLTYVEGTSVSSAFVSGAVALMLSYDNTLTPKKIKSIINKSAKKLNSLDSLCYSEGCLNVYGSLKKCKDTK